MASDGSKTLKLIEKIKDVIGYTAWRLFDQGDWLLLVAILFECAVVIGAITWLSYIVGGRP